MLHSKHFSGSANRQCMRIGSLEISTSHPSNAICWCHKAFAAVRSSAGFGNNISVVMLQGLVCVLGLLLGLTLEQSSINYYELWPWVTILSRLIENSRSTKILPNWKSVLVAWSQKWPSCLLIRRCFLVSSSMSHPAQVVFNLRFQVLHMVAVGRLQSTNRWRCRFTELRYRALWCRQ